MAGSRVFSSDDMIAPPPVGSPLVPFRWTVERFSELNYLDIFNDVRAILVRGEIYLRPRRKPQHEYVIGKTHDWLWETVPENEHHARCQTALVIDEFSALCPDVSVVEGPPERYTDHHPTTAVLVVEISNGTLAFDTTTKAELYATAGVPDYWVLDVENRQLIIYRDPVPLPTGLGATAYRSHAAFGPDATVSPLAAPTASVRVADLLP